MGANIRENLIEKKVEEIFSREGTPKRIPSEGQRNQESLRRPQGRAVQEVSDNQSTGSQRVWGEVEM